MRLDRLLAVARRDLAQELRGRRGWVLPAVMAGLLLPISSMPKLEAALPAPPPVVVVSGDVPESVADHPGIVVGDGASVRLERTPDALLVRGPVPGALREALDDGSPVVDVRSITRPLPLPGRTLLLALISASTLTGAISASVAGERSHRTLIALLTASISRVEVVVGKWLAWTGLGTLSSLLAATIAIALGRVEPGLWVLPMAAVPGGTVALGLFLVRRASDVVGGTTVALRVLPAVLSIGGVLAWLAGQQAPWLGSLIPLGGALLAAGDTWQGLGPPLLATLSTALFSVVALALTARDLEAETTEGRPLSPMVLTAATALGAGLIWLVPVLGPLLWSSAGNPVMTERLDPAVGVLAGAAGLALLTLTHHGRSGEGPEWTSPAVRSLLLGVVVGGALAMTAPLGWLLAVPDAPLLAVARLRLDAALVPGWAGAPILLLTVVADELLFRGWLLRRAGPVASVIAWTAVKCPLDPLLGLMTGALLVALVRAGGSVGGAVVARLVWALIAGLSLPVGPLGALLVGLATLLALLPSARVTGARAPG